MKVEISSESEFTIFLNKESINTFNIENEEEIKEYFKNIFQRLKKYYNLDIKGYYNIEVYINNNYGIIAELYRLDSDYIKIFGNKVDLKISFNTNAPLLYKTEDYFLIDILKGKQYEVYKQNDHYFINLLEEINSDLITALSERTTIVYGDKVNKIYRKGILIK